MQTEVIKTQWVELSHKLGKEFEKRVARVDETGDFVEENYQDLKSHGYFSAIIPEELGGGGVSHSQMCDILRIIGQHCGSTALSMSMHNHLLAANIWNYKNGKGGESLLRKVADTQITLVSTGARDFLESNGEIKKVKDGYLVSATKHFASQSATGDMMITSAPYEDPELGWMVLHFPVPFDAEGVTVMNNWNTMGMRGTGSNTIKLENVFVPESAIGLKRPQGDFHPFWNVILTVAMPLIMSAYMGIAEKAYNIALTFARKNKNPKPYLSYQIGELHNELTNAQVHWKDMVSIANDLNFQPVDENGQAILSRKSNLSRACISVVTKTMEVVGGQGYFKSFGLERLFRDVQAAQYHPLQEKDQQLFIADYLLKEK